MGAEVIFLACVIGMVQWKGEWWFPGSGEAERGVTVCLMGTESHSGKGKSSASGGCTMRIYVTSLKHTEKWSK